MGVLDASLTRPAVAALLVRGVCGAWVGSGDEPLTVEDWLRRIESKRAVALAFKDSREHCREAWLAAGAAVEFALKARIMRREWLSGWPVRDVRPELHTHDLHAFGRFAGIDRAPVPPHLRHRWATVLAWDHGHEYRASPMPRKVARQMVESAFGDQGVIAWLLIGV
jgi:hypothetical protein